MNSFLDLHSDIDYRNTNRPYYAGTWEYINVASTFLIPFQFTNAVGNFSLSTIDTEGSETDITTHLTGAQLITGWTLAGGGTLDNTGPLINSWAYSPGSNITSDNFILTSGDVAYFDIDISAFPDAGTITVALRRGVTVLWTETMDELEAKSFTITQSGADHNILITVGGGADTATSNTPHCGVSDNIEASGTYWWYNGGVLSSTLSGVFYLKLTVGSDIFYSDWCDVCGFTDKSKITISSSYDYGTIKYAGGYEQWMYKNATVRRAPKAEIEITGDKLNGSIVEEKKTSAVRYKITMKCTEAEYEALVHSIGGTLSITDQTGKSYTAVNIELNDPTWYRANGIVELSFVDSGNINIWTRNNSTL